MKKLQGLRDAFIGQAKIEKLKQQENEPRPKVRPITATKIFHGKDQK